jgi:hypothetical protein
MANELAVAPEMDTMELGRVLAKSGFFSDAKDASKAVVKVLAGRELGFGPIASMTGVYIVKGKPTLSANMMAAAVKRSQKYDYRVAEHTEDRCKIVFYQEGEEVGVSEFTMQDAKRAGLGGHNWSKYPKNMLFARALSNGVKWHCPDVMNGQPVYTPDELGAEVDGETGEIIDGQAEIVESVVPEPPKEEVAPEDVRTPKGTRLGDLDAEAWQRIVSFEADNLGTYPEDVLEAAVALLEDADV